MPDSDEPSIDENESSSGKRSVPEQSVPEVAPETRPMVSSGKGIPLQDRPTEVHEVELGKTDAFDTDDPSLQVTGNFNSEESSGNPKSNVVFKNGTTDALEKIGRYHIEKELGAGGFGCVYLAVDTELHRRVAIKVPHKSRISRPADIEKFLDEARTLASLDHPGVVPIYDFDRFDDRCYVVSKFIDGETLADRMKREPLAFHRVVDLMLSLGQTLQHIHRVGVVHRDIKPANLLLDQNENCFVTDFGLALREEGYGKGRGRVGTVIYMSPEQARGEGHLVDGRSDLFSLGVVMYEMLTGQLPFYADGWKEVVHLICNQEPRPLRGHNPKIPKELERICLKLLSKRAADRYLIAEDLVEDLEHFLEQKGDPSQSTASSTTTNRGSHESQDQLIGIVPRGLRSFDQEDAAYFRELLPGTRDRNGLPDSLRFWRRRIESDDPLVAFRVGVIYGSSGSGKSSFVNAGLVPTLDTHVETISLEASGNRTESQLLSGLRKRVADLPRDLNLVESLAWIRRQLEDDGFGRKILIVIDQFEQWLHAHGNEQGAELTLALRQCDGQHLQCLLLVRDDFWVGVSRFVDQLEVDLVRSQNLAMVDLFDKRHARKVLAEYGRGYSRLPENLSNLSLSQSQFLDQAIEGLADDGKIIPVQLVTFAEIMKSRDWNVRSLQELGGIEGVGIRFLEESLGANAPVENRSHEDAAQAILKLLLPEAGTNIKGAMRSESELRVAAGYQSEPKRLAKLLTILDTDLRLITPTDPDTSSESEVVPGQRYYQLTHDYLVPAVRQWLQYRQQLSLGGRAAMRLADRADVWKSRPDKKHLPSWIEWAVFKTLTKASRWSDPERRMMAAATKRHMTSLALFLVACGMLGWFGYDFWGRNRAQVLTAQLSVADTSQVAGVVDQLEAFRGWSNGPLTDLSQREAIDEPAGLHGRLALLRMAPEDRELLSELSEQSLKTELKELPLIRAELEGNRGLSEIKPRFWEVLQEPTESSDARFRAALMLASYDPPRSGKEDRSGIEDSDADESGNSNDRWLSVREFLAREVIRQTLRNPKDYLTIVESISNTADFLKPELRTLLIQPEESAERQKVPSLLVDLWQRNPATLADLFLDANAEQLDVFLAAMDNATMQQIRSVLDAALQFDPDANMPAEKQQYVSNRQVNAGAYLLRRGSPESVWPLFQLHEIPSTRSGLIERVVVMDADPELLITRLVREERPDVSSALMLALGTFGEERLSEAQRSRCRDLAREAFQASPNPSAHSASEWMLGQLDDRAWLDSTTGRLREDGWESLEKGRQQAWAINSQGQTLIRIETSPTPIQVADTEVTVGQFLRYRPGHRYNESQAPQEQCPMIQVTWADAVDYCQWLTLEEGLGDDEQCYVAVPGDEHGWRLKEDYRTKKGYRLLLSGEWETAYRGDAITRLAYGYDESILQQYGWTLFRNLPSVMPVKEKKPLPSGVFGMLGNVTEWCSDLRGDSQYLRAIRGARCNAYFEDVLQSTTQGGFSPNTRYFSLGFRVARSAAGQTD